MRAVPGPGDLEGLPFYTLSNISAMSTETKAITATLPDQTLRALMKFAAVSYTSQRKRGAVACNRARTYPIMSVAEKRYVAAVLTKERILLNHAHNHAK